jgi:hypothetical protein
MQWAYFRPPVYHRQTLETQKVRPLWMRCKHPLFLCGCQASFVRAIVKAVSRLKSDSGRVSCLLCQRPSSILNRCGITYISPDFRTYAANSQRTHRLSGRENRSGVDVSRHAVHRRAPASERQKQYALQRSDLRMRLKSRCLPWYGVSLVPGRWISRRDPPSARPCQGLGLTVPRVHPATCATPAPARRADGCSH